MKAVRMICLFASALCVQAASIDDDLNAELNRLADLRAQIAAEKPALAKKTNQLAADLTARRRAMRLLELDRREQQAELDRLNKRIEELEQESAYIDSLLLDARKQAETAFPPGEAETWAGRLRAADQSVTGRIDLVAASIQQLNDSFGLRRFPGEALAPSGELIPGTFLQAGPVVWFLSNDRKTGGLTVENRSLLAELLPGASDPGSLSDLADGRAAAPPFDPTLGSAIALNRTTETWFDHLRKGGLWIWPILLLALIATCAAVGKAVQLSRIRELRPDAVRRILQALKQDRRDEAENELAAMRHPARGLLQRGIELSNCPVDDIEEGMYEKFLETEPPLQRGLAFIAITSATAPLLGLLGTVTGMIYTFRLINVFGTGDARSLASGISEALVTTEMGLVVAIPALILHALLARRVQSIRASMELVSLAFVNGLSPQKETEK
ncbi:MAG: MotA/TolQ/ExbB proton channel family protein [Kiritimatiellales bacterium]